MVKVPISEMVEANKTLRAVVRGSKDDVLMENVLLKTFENNLTIRATDGVTLAALKVSAEVEKPLKVLIPFQKFSDFVGIWNEDLILTKTKARLIIKSGKDEIKVPTQQEVEEFEQKFEVLNPPKKLLDVDGLPWKIVATSQVTNPDHIRMPALQGIHIKADKGILTVEAADGLRFLWIKEKQDTPISFDCIVNHRAGEVMNTLPATPGKVWRDQRYFYYRNSNSLFAFLLIGEPNFPVLSHLVPQHKKAIVTFDKPVLDGLLKKINLIGAERVSLSQNRDNVHAEAFNDDYECILDVPAEIEGKMPQIIVQVSHLSYISSLLKTKQISFNLESSSSPLWFVDGGTLYLTTPYSSIT